MLDRRQFLTGLGAGGARRVPLARRARPDRAAPVALDGRRADGAARVRRQVPRAGGSGDRRRGQGPRLSRAARSARSARSCSSSRKGSSTSWSRAPRSGAASRRSCRSSTSRSCGATGLTCTASSTARSDARRPTISSGPCACGRSPGATRSASGRSITRSRDVTEPGQLAGLKIRTIQSPIYVKAVELMGASPTPMAFGEVYTSLQTGVIDGYEHDASTTLQQRFYEVAHYMARTRPHRRRARPVGVDREPGPPSRRPPRDARAGRARGRAAPARDGPAGGCGGDRAARRARHDHPRDRRPRLPSRAERLWNTEARALGVASWLEAIRA